MKRINTMVVYKSEKNHNYQDRTDCINNLQKAVNCSPTSIMWYSSLGASHFLNAPTAKNTEDSVQRLCGAFGGTICTNVRLRYEEQVPTVDSVFFQFQGTFKTTDSIIFIHKIIYMHLDKIITTCNFVCNCG
ncbi:hypothetical protein EGR_02109 [Echinococcus granulosus]|uniref:Uncharacterized protein n=1 Tax=Echinococcus granulosus TaxID=6210 RepID=W6UN73_ECHGR|nr:hypothetical protein EGR_02109 [Echinococcus granulosus]EUB63015.1 hypothetical protein EGR_02109 [Echinococcus granulosus]